MTKAANKSEIAAAYDRWAETYDSDPNRTRELAAQVLRKVDLTFEDRKVIEVGCGTGRNTDWLTTRAAHVTALVKNGELVDALSAGEEGEVVLDRTPFYAESGGQIGDTGVFETEDARLLVKDAVSPVSGVIAHKVVVEQGTLRAGETITARVDAEKRARTMANHTATHLLHAALREVLGPHVKQVQQTLHRPSGLLRFLSSLRQIRSTSALAAQGSA